MGLENRRVSGECKPYLKWHFNNETKKHPNVTIPTTFGAF